MLNKINAIEYSGDKQLEADFVPGYFQVVAEIPKTASEKPQERFLVEVFATDAEGVFTKP